MNELLTGENGIAALLLGGIGILWKIVRDQHKREEARAEATEKEFKELQTKHSDIRFDLAKMEGRIYGSNQLAEKLKGTVEETRDLTTKVLETMKDVKGG